MNNKVSKHGGMYYLEPRYFFHLLTELGVGKLSLIRATGMSRMTLVSSTTVDGGGSLPRCMYKAGRPW